jgi:hypothetical protein
LDSIALEEKEEEEEEEEEEEGAGEGEEKKNPKIFVHHHHHHHRLHVAFRVLGLMNYSGPIPHWSGCPWRHFPHG